jgi:Protein of unknown function DUF72
MAVRGLQRAPLLALAAPDCLAHYATSFRTVEVNNAFYRLPEEATFARWRDTAPDDGELQQHVDIRSWRGRRGPASTEPPEATWVLARHRLKVTNAAVAPACIVTVRGHGACADGL